MSKPKSGNDTFSFLSRLYKGREDNTPASGPPPAGFDGEAADDDTEDPLEGTGEMHYYEDDEYGASSSSLSDSNSSSSSNTPHDSPTKGSHPPASMGQGHRSNNDSAENDSQRPRLAPASRLGQGTLGGVPSQQPYRVEFSHASVRDSSPAESQSQPVRAEPARLSGGRKHRAGTGGTSRGSPDFRSQSPSVSRAMGPDALRGGASPRFTHIESGEIPSPMAPSPSAPPKETRARMGGAPATWTSPSYASSAAVPRSGFAASSTPSSSLSGSPGSRVNPTSTTTMDLRVLPSRPPSYVSTDPSDGSSLMRVDDEMYRKASAYYNRCAQAIMEFNYSPEGRYFAQVAKEMKVDITLLTTLPSDVLNMIPPENVEPTPQEIAKAQTDLASYVSGMRAAGLSSFTGFGVGGGSGKTLGMGRKTRRGAAAAEGGTTVGQQLMLAGMTPDQQLARIRFYQTHANIVSILNSLAVPQAGRPLIKSRFLLGAEESAMMRLPSSLKRHNAQPEDFYQDPESRRLFAQMVAVGHRHCSSSTSTGHLNRALDDQSGGMRELAALMDFHCKVVSFPVRHVKYYVDGVDSSAGGGGDVALRYSVYDSVLGGIGT